MRILVVEDEKKVAEALREGLEAEHYEVTAARTGEEGFYLLQSQSFDLVILDLMLPGRDGLEILTTLRARGVETPVLVLTARDTVEDRVMGLDGGADDYLVKPFAFPELLARIRALVRRGRIDSVLRLKLADNLLTLTRVDSGHLKLRAERVDLASLAEEVVDCLRVLKVFDRFFRVDKDRSRAQGGTGLGLAIAKHAVELNGGRIELESEQGKGTTFRIILSCEKGEPQ